METLIAFDIHTITTPTSTHTHTHTHTGLEVRYPLDSRCTED